MIGSIRTESQRQRLSILLGYWKVITPEFNHGGQQSQPSPWTSSLTWSIDGVGAPHLLPLAIISHWRPARQPNLTLHKKRVCFLSIYKALRRATELCYEVRRPETPQLGHPEDRLSSSIRGLEHTATQAITDGGFLANGVALAGSVVIGSCYGMLTLGQILAG